MERPVVYRYDDYRLFLSDSYSFLKRTTRHFSYRYFARKAGFNSTNFLKMVMEGDRNLSNDSIPKFAHAFELNEDEGLFFGHLVHFNQAGELDEKLRVFRKMLTHPPFKAIKLVDEDEFAFLSQWYHVIVREMVTLPDFQEDPEWIARRIGHGVSCSDTENAIKTLLKIGLLRREMNGKLSQADRLISTKSEASTLAVRNFHERMGMMALESIVDVPQHERDITSSTLVLNKDQINEVKKRVEQFRKDLIRSLEKSCDGDAEVFQLNVQFFPVTRKGGQNEA